MSHIPVLLNEMLAVLSPQKGEVYVDATFGGGGYSREILEAADCRVIALDRDPSAVVKGKALEQEYPGRFQLSQGTFSQLKDILLGLGVSQVHGFVFDLGVSSTQLDTPERGFSFRHDGPLDMRMSKEGITAADVVNRFSEEELADIFYRYGDEKKSRAIARKIVEIRQSQPIQTTGQLSSLVRSVVKGKKTGIDPATLTFQSLRIFVNNELIEIDKGLKIAEECLLPGGRLLVVTFHSLEDRLVKQFLKTRLLKGSQEKSRNQALKGSRHWPDTSVPLNVATFVQGNGISVKGITPSLAEQRLNPRARSARLRAAIRLSTIDQASTQIGRGY